MNDEIKKQLEETTGIAFDKYAQRHPTLGSYLKSNKATLLASAISTVENDPEVTAAMQLAKTESDLQKVVELIERLLPKLINI